MRFEWDPAKNAANQQKHRVPFGLAQRVWDDPSHLEGNVTEDEYGEDRWEAIGRPDLSRPIVLSVIFTPREPGILRIISARKADPDDERDYYSLFPHS